MSPGGEFVVAFSRDMDQWWHFMQDAENLHQEVVGSTSGITDGGTSNLGTPSTREIASVIWKFVGKATTTSREEFAWRR